MLNKLSLLLLIASFECLFCLAQPPVKQYTWWDPAKNEFPVIEGQAWPAEMKGTYKRLPARAEKTVRRDIWELAQNTAGLIISFRSNSPEIVVRYKVSGSTAFPHMPATGVSGLDLYGIGENGNWLWCKGAYSFNDTITYTFKNIEANDSSYPFHKKGGEYRLYLPLYNNITWLEIGVEPGAVFNPLPPRKDKPILVYGTSIAQGGCASRPGNAWTSILGRKLERPLINLGFSGNGLLEKELINMIAEIDAKVYVLDCLPNLVGQDLPAAEIWRRIMESVHSIRNSGKLAPVLLTEHGGYTDELINPQNRKKVADINKLMKAAFHQLEQEGVKNIFLLKKEEINLDYNSMVDGVHPSDGGMFQYAAAYERKLREIMHEPIGNYTTTQPCTQNRDANTYDWISRHNEILALQDKTPTTVFIGNSITHFWGGSPTAQISRGKASWDKIIEPHQVINAGFGWDRIENVLWRVYHDELDGLVAKQVVLLIGTNNLDYNPDQEIILGLKQLIEAIKFRQPASKILVLGLIPREEKEPRIGQLNKRIEKLANALHAGYAEVGKGLLNTKGVINSSLFDGDGVHPNAAGYQRMSEALAPYLVK
ncbi:SGNH/GDSL hydrolase family protein [Flavihumibacter fluvii]|uniref:SGNH/GDSL hydrolase family protein n=1 Tax=Flavihumibacter fluvii TaxID=2838157 RepID=UPI001BDE676D|nr:SGNH/GDSL hydrolase family protein [Flavihumibacter fluvii]ULQ54736.1 SGNH/GDSL hydrolase family protein [Flavihumibacter fluvii]